MHQRLWDGRSLKWLNLKWHMKCHLQIKPGWRKPFRTFLSLLRLFLPLSLCFKRRLTCHSPLWPSIGTTPTWKVSSVADYKGRKDMPSFPQSSKNNSPDWSPSTSQISCVRHKPKLFWHINTDLCWKNGHWAINRTSIKSVSLLCFPGRLQDWLNPFTWENKY